MNSHGIYTQPPQSQQPPQEPLQTAEEPYSIDEFSSPQELSHSELATNQQNNLPRSGNPEAIHQPINRPSPNFRGRPFHNRSQTQIQGYNYQYNQMSPQGNILDSHPRIRRKNESLTNEEMRMVRKDVKEGLLNKKTLMKKYSISQSTLNRYIRKFKQLEESKKETTSQNLAAKGAEDPEESQKETKTVQKCQGNESMASESTYPQGYSPFVSRKKNSKVRMIEGKLIQIYKEYPQIYQSEVASMLSAHFKQEITVHVVSRCLRNISNRQKQLTYNQPEEGHGYPSSLNALEMAVRNRFAFARQFLVRNPQRVVYIGERLYYRAGTQEQPVHIGMAVGGEGLILHWKLKNHVFLSNQIAKFIEQIHTKVQGCTVLLDNINLHRQQPIRQLFKEKAVSHLYLPPCSPQLSPIEPIFACVAARLNNKLRDDLSQHQTLRMVHVTLKQLQQHSFTRQVGEARHFIDVAFRKQPFPFDPIPQQTQR